MRSDYWKIGESTLNTEESIFIIEDVIKIKGRGIAVSGYVQQGCFYIGDSVIIICRNGNFVKSIIKSIDVFGHLEYAEKGDCVGIRLEGKIDIDLHCGDILKSTNHKVK